MPINITMPALSPTMEEGNLAKWLVKEGDKVKSGDVIAEIETDKATMEVEAVDEGTVAKIVVPAGTEGVKVNALIAVLAAEGEDAGAAAKGARAPAKPRHRRRQAPRPWEQTSAKQTEAGAVPPAAQRRGQRQGRRGANGSGCIRATAPVPSPRRSPGASPRMPASTSRPSAAPVRMAASSRPMSRRRLPAAAPRPRPRPSRRRGARGRPRPSSRCRTRRC